MDDHDGYWMHALLTTLALTNLAIVWVALNYLG